MYELKGTILDFVCPFFFSGQMASPKVMNAKKLQKNFLHTTKNDLCDAKGGLCTGYFIKKSIKRTF